jgi:hypothetical protein
MANKLNGDEHGNSIALAIHKSWHQWRGGRKWVMMVEGLRPKKDVHVAKL